MIGRVTRGSTCGGLSAYLNQDKGRDDGLEDCLLGATSRVKWSTVRNLSVRDPKDAATIKGVTAEANVRVEKPVYHLSLSAAQDEELSREQWEKVADRVLIVAHRDKDPPHVHLVINRVHPGTLKAWDNSFDHHRVEKSLCVSCPCGRPTEPPSPTLPATATPGVLP